MKKTRRSAWLVALLLTAATPAHPVGAEAGTKPLPRVHVLATGGTIAGAQSTAGGHGYRAGAYDVDALLASVPTLAGLARVSGEQVASIGSQDMNDDVWLALARRVEAALASPGNDAVVVTHGTDTLEETSYFLSLVTGSDKPVVLVGAMRPATALSADGPGNLHSAVAVATDPGARGKGALVVLNDTVHYARNVVKTDTTGVHAFASLNRGPAGQVHAGRVHWFEPMDRTLGRATGFDVAQVPALPRVDVLYAHANMSVDLIEAAVRNGARGLVLAGVGNGNMTTPALEALTQAARRGVVVVRSTRLPAGIVLRNLEVDDDARGFVVAGELNPAKARVLLQLALTQTTDVARIQRMFYEY